MKRTLAFAALLLAISLPFQSKGGNPAGASPVAGDWVAAWNSHDPAKWATHFTSDVYFFSDVPDLKLELADSSIEGNHGSIQWILTGTDKGVFKTGKPFKVRGVSIITVDHGKISRSIDYYDLATIMKQVGALPAS